MIRWIKSGTVTSAMLYNALRKNAGVRVVYMLTFSAPEDTACVLFTSERVHFDVENEEVQMSFLEDDSSGYELILSTKHYPGDDVLLDSGRIIAVVLNSNSERVAVMSAALFDVPELRINFDDFMALSSMIGFFKALKVLGAEYRDGMEDH